MQKAARTISTLLWLRIRIDEKGERTRPLPFPFFLYST
jgi:hypothetical protein